MKNINDSKLKKVAIFIADSNGAYPVPSTKGGAVPTLIDHLIEVNTHKKKAQIYIVSFYDKEAEKKSHEYENVTFIWIKVPKIVKALDYITFKLISVLFKKVKALSYKSLFSLIYYILKASKILKKRDFDKVVLENNVPMAWIIKLSKYKKDYYYHFHNIPRINAKCADVFQKCKGILCVSDYVGKQILNGKTPLNNISENQIKVLYNCVDTSKFYNVNNNDLLDEIRMKYKIKKSDKVVLFVGRLSEEKGIDILMEACKQMKNDNMKILIVGSMIHNYNVKDQYQCKLEELSKELGDKVIFTGYINQKELVNIYNIANVAVLPSMWEEPAGLTMIEALACGIPVITTNSGGIPEYVDKYAIVLDKNNDLIKNIKIELTKIFDSNDIDVQAGMDRISKCFDSNEYLDRFLESIE